MEVDEAIGRLRVIRRFAQTPLPAAEVEAILNAGRRAGSSKNLQRWHFIVIRDRESLAQLAEVGPFAGHLAGASVAIALITPDPKAADSPYSVLWDLGRAAQNMVLAAWAHGIGSAPATVYEQAMCRQILGYPADRHCEYILSFGYPADPTALARPLRAGGRQQLTDIVSNETWPNEAEH